MGKKNPDIKEDVEIDDEIRELIGRDLKMTRKQIRARARRRQRMVAADEEAMQKPIEEWDLEELARGRAKNSRGNFSGAGSGYLSRGLHEKITRQFVIRAKGELQSHAVLALKVLENILDNDDTDEDGKPVISPSVKLETAKFTLEHVLGKPTQRVEQDISVRLQGILSMATGSPAANVIPSSVIEVATGLKPGKTHKAVVAQVPGRLTGSDMDDDEDEERDVG